VWLTDINDVFDVDSVSELEGKRVSLRDIRVAAADGDQFWIMSAERQTKVRVVPAERGLVTVRPGGTVSLQGEFRRDTSADEQRSGAELYLYAYVVRPAW
jgi:hypothetical protein